MIRNRRTGQNEAARRAWRKGARSVAMGMFFLALGNHAGGNAHGAGVYLALAQKFARQGLGKDRP